MQDKNLITASIVMYKNDLNELSRAVDSFLTTELPKRLYLIDNSPSDIMRKEFSHPEIEYIFTGKNLGFGRAHNLALSKINDFSKYHLIINPDVYFGNRVVANLIDKLERETNVMMIAPKVLYPNGDHQFTCRRYPTPIELISRNSIFCRWLFSSLIKKGEYRDHDLSKPFYPDFMHGCFLLFKTRDLIAIGGFDNRYFLYMEDVDIGKKIDNYGRKKLYFPQEEIFHTFKKESFKKLHLFYYHLISSIKYFYKWGLW